MQRYYLDSCIWIDYFENRSDRFRPLDEWAFSLIKNIIENNDVIIYSNLVKEELAELYSEEQIRNIFSIVPKLLLIKVAIKESHIKEAITLSKRLKIPAKDATHAILARDNNAIMVTRDKHFYELKNEVFIVKPEDLI